jgi:hypothetical protein
MLLVHTKKAMKTQQYVMVFIIHCLSGIKNMNNVVKCLITSGLKKYKKGLSPFGAIAVLIPFL